MAPSFPAQVLVAVVGVLAIIEAMPPKYRHMIKRPSCMIRGPSCMFKGPSLIVDFRTGIVEGFLTFLFTFAFLFVILKGPRSELLRAWLLAILMVILVMVGLDYTGAFMNPAHTFGWPYLGNWHNTWEPLGNWHSTWEPFCVYWIFPFIGVIAAAWLFCTMLLCG